jgi:hypothetical protein
MDLDDGGIDHGVFHVGLVRAGFEKPSEKIGFDPPRGESDPSRRASQKSAGSA